MMAGAGRNRRILLQDLPDSLERTERRRTDGISHGIVRPGPSSLGPHEVVLAVLEEHECALDVALGGDLPERASVRERYEAREVVVETGDVAVTPAAVDDVESTVA